MAKIHILYQLCVNDSTYVHQIYQRGHYFHIKNAATKFGSASGVQYDPLFWDTAKEVVQVLRVITEN